MLQTFDEDYFDAAWKLSDECRRVKNDIARISGGNKSMIFDETKGKPCFIAC
jgi:hypothetical protein